MNFFGPCIFSLVGPMVSSLEQRHGTLTVQFWGSQYLKWYFWEQHKQPQNLLFGHINTWPWIWKKQWGCNILWGKLLKPGVERTQSVPFFSWFSQVYPCQQLRLETVKTEPLSFDLILFKNLPLCCTEINIFWWVFLKVLFLSSKNSQGQCLIIKTTSEQRRHKCTAAMIGLDFFLCKFLRNIVALPVKILKDLLSGCP